MGWKGFLVDAKDYKTDMAQDELLVPALYPLLALAMRRLSSASDNGERLGRLR